MARSKKIVEEVITQHVQEITQMSIGSIEEFVIDLSTVADPDPLPVRTYEGMVQEISVYLSASKGAPTTKISYFIAPDQYPVDFDAENAPDGIKLTAYGSLDCGTPPANPQPTRLGLSRVRKLYEHHGLETGSITMRPQEELGGAWGLDASDLSAFVGTRVLISVVHEVFEGQNRAKVGQINPLT